LYTKLGNGSSPTMKLIQVSMMK